MHFPTLMAEADPPADVAAITAELIARKAVTRELGVGVIPAPLLAFIDTELAQATDTEARLRPPDPQARAEADALFRAETLRLDAG
jgi:predicted nucleotidyltransferase